MIIKNLIAENLLKYRHLQLTDLPEKGIIAISGCNESGKSSIGEAICFALFGRTFAIGPSEIQKLIRWGENHSSVTLDLRLANGVRYQLYRAIDREHNHSARLSRTDDLKHPIARGKVAVEEILKELLGYDFEAFVDSLYLAQREITAPHPQGHAIHVMAGIAPLAACNKELLEDMARDKALLEELAKRNIEVKSQLNDLAFDNQRTHVLAADQTDIAGREQGIQTHQQTLADTAAAYQERKSRQQQDAYNITMLSRLRLVAFLLAALALGGWALTIGPADSSLLHNIATFIAYYVPSTWLLYSGLTSTLGSIVAWARIAMLHNNEKKLYESGSQLADAITAIDKLEISLPKSLRIRNSGTGGSTIHRVRLDPEARLRLRRRLPQGLGTVADVDDMLAIENSWLEQIQSYIAQRKIDLHQDIQRERERRQTCERLNSTDAAIKREETEIQHRIRIRIQAEELLQGAMRHLTSRFNHHLRGLAGRTLPMFTDHRYQHLQIDTDLTVRAFSNEKRDFMELDEVSSGTQRQIMLAIRLSLTQQLIDRVVRGSQFIFLDEPFAFFDEARTRSTLMALPRLSDDITQVWVVAQQFPENFALERTIICQRDCNEYRSDDPQKQYIN